MASTLKKLKNEEKLLAAYANELGIDGDSWDEIADQIVISEDFRSTRSDKSGIQVMPRVCLETDETCWTLADAVFQPTPNAITSRVSFAPSFVALAKSWRDRDYTSAPRINKAVSYPSVLQRGKSEEILAADNPWLIDIFSFGVQYCRMMTDSTAYRVVDTSCYELWNRVNEEESRYISGGPFTPNPPETVVERFLEVLQREKYEYLWENEKRRNTYLEALAKVTGLPAVISMRDEMQRSQFINAVGRMLGKTFDGIVRNPFCYEGATGARNFVPFVCAEEAMLSEVYGINACIGPIREDLPLNVAVLRAITEENLLSGYAGEIGAAERKPLIKWTPTFWYTRPTTFPPLTLEATEREVLSALEGDVIATKFAAENLKKLGREPDGETTKAVANEMYRLMRDIKREYERP